MKHLKTYKIFESFPNLETFITSDRILLSISTLDPLLSAPPIAINIPLVTDALN